MFQKLTLERFLLDMLYIESWTCVLFETNTNIAVNRSIRTVVITLSNILLLCLSEPGASVTCDVGIISEQRWESKWRLLVTGVQRTSWCHQQSVACGRDLCWSCGHGISRWFSAGQWCSGSVATETVHLFTRPQRQYLRQLLLRQWWRRWRAHTCYVVVDDVTAETIVMYRFCHSHCRLFVA